MSSVTAPVRLDAALDGRQVVLTARGLEITLVTVAAVIAAATALVEAPGALRVPFGLLGALILPGYGISLALLPGELDRVERWASAFVLSLIATAGLVLVLDASPWGVNPVPLIVALSTVAIASTLVGGLRSDRLGPGVAFQRPSMPVSKRAGVLIVLAVPPLLAGAIAVAPGLPGTPQTEFYVVGRTGLAAEYPTRVPVGQKITLDVGLTNREAVATAFSVVVREGGRQVGSSGAINVAAGATWNGGLTFQPAAAGERQEITIQLFKSGDPSPMRSLRLWLDVSTTSPAPDTTPLPTPPSTPSQTSTPTPTTGPTARPPMTPIPLP